MRQGKNGVTTIANEFFLAGNVVLVKYSLSELAH